MLPLQSAVGIVGLLGLAYLLSENKRHVPWRMVGAGMVLHFVLAALLIKVPAVQSGFGHLNDAVTGLTDATRAGTSFVFGYLGGGDAPWTTTNPAASFVLAFQALPLILVVSALSALLFHWNVIPVIVRGFAWVLRRTIGVDGPIGVAATMNIFVGMVEAPLVIKPYLRTESRAGLFVIMTGGMATVAGSVMVLYATILKDIVVNPLGQILTASVLATPAAIVISYMMIPEDPALPPLGERETAVLLPKEPGDNMMSVITRGTVEGLQLVLSVVAMLIVLVALVGLANAIIGFLPDVMGASLTLQRIFGWAMSPLALMMGIPWSEAQAAGALLGTKTVLNELIAYADLAALPEGTLEARSRLILTYALAGFANFSGLGIMIGGLVGMVPERRADIVQLAPRTLISGTIATCLCGATAGLFTWS